MDNHITELERIAAEAKDEGKDGLYAMLCELEEIERVMHMDCYDARVIQQLKVMPAMYDKETDLAKAERLVEMLESLQEYVEAFKEDVDYLLEKANEEVIIEQDKLLKAREAQRP